MGHSRETQRSLGRFAEHTVWLVVGAGCGVASFVLGFALSFAEVGFVPMSCVAFVIGFTLMFKRWELLVGAMLGVLALGSIGGVLMWSNLLLTGGALALLIRSLRGEWPSDGSDTSPSENR